MNRLISFTVIAIFSIQAVAATFDEVVTKAHNDGFKGIIYYKANNTIRIKSVNGSFTKRQFALGSISKLFTQMAILQLIEKGAIEELTDSVGKYLEPEQIPTAWKSWVYKVSLLDLIQHRSGLPALLYPTEGQKSIYNHVNNKNGLVTHFFSEDNAAIDYATLQANLSNADENGELYSNFGYNLLAIVIENVTGQSYRDYLNTNIFMPANMNETFSGYNSSLLNLVKNTPQLVNPHVYAIDYNARTENKPKPHIKLLPNTLSKVEDYNFIFTKGAGSIISIVDNLQKWISLTFDSNTLLRTDAAKKLLLSFDEEDGIWGHQGELPGYQSILLVDRKNHRSVIILSDINYNAYNFITELTDKNGADIINFEQRGGVGGLEREMELAQSEYPYLMPVNIAIDLLESE